MPRAAGFYQILGAITSTLNYKWPEFTLNFMIWMRLFTLDLPALPFVGCLSRSSFVNSFFITISAPPALIGFMILLHRMAMFTEYEVWCVSHRAAPAPRTSRFSVNQPYTHLTRLACRRNSIYVLFLVYPTTCETIVSAFRCYELQDGSQYLISDFNIQCSGAYKALMWPAAFTSLVVYVQFGMHRLTQALRLIQRLHPWATSTIAGGTSALFAGTLLECR